MDHVSHFLPDQVKHGMSGDVADLAYAGVEAARRMRTDALAIRQHQDDLFQEAQNMKHGQIGAEGPVCMLCYWYFDSKNAKKRRNQQTSDTGASAADSGAPAMDRYINNGPKSHGETPETKSLRFQRRRMLAK